MAKTIEEFTALFHQELKDHYPQGEIDAFAFLAFSELLGISRDDIRIQKDELLKPEIAERLHQVIDELKTQKPIQYILGSAEFYGCKLRVNKNVLIPRPETEELVDLILKETRDKGHGTGKGFNILDIGTGSGCIAIALKKKLPEANVSALDISEEALLVAKTNAIANQTRLNFLQGDILSPFPTGKGSFDIIVSNPPYVRASEKNKMSKNVLEFEPHLALFVQDNDPLLFYKAIADFAIQNLSPKGTLYFEINEALGNNMKNLLETKGFKGVRIVKDISGKDRISKAWMMDNGKFKNPD